MQGEIARATGLIAGESVHEAVPAEIRSLAERLEEVTGDLIETRCIDGSFIVSQQSAAGDGRRRSPAADIA
jgi:hypothetical protein